MKSLAQITLRMKSFGCAPRRRDSPSLGSRQTTTSFSITKKQKTTFGTRNMCLIHPNILNDTTLVDPPTGRRFQATSLLSPNRDRPNLTYEFHRHSTVWRWTGDRMLRAEAEGRIYCPPNGGVPREKRFLDEQEGVPVSSVWTDIAPVNAVAQERLRFPTQKPEALLERIIRASSKENDLV